ncbi:unnamed protein product [Phytophthora fragariaefolia]|uniref:Unnamed protein product n=1 Tax=Phytophthora fragariaefolia TaxID=1490495 RepID=A0A9W6U055_9STRA|nr:unnamed protein product [Phytophthora fragariaefolia]
MRCCSKRLGAFCVLRAGPPNHRLEEVWTRVTSTFAGNPAGEEGIDFVLGEAGVVPEYVRVRDIANGRDGAGGLDGADGAGVGDRGADVAAARGGAGGRGGADVAGGLGGADVAAARGGVEFVAVLGVDFACGGADVAAARRGAGITGDHGGGDVADRAGRDGGDMGASRSESDRDNDESEIDSANDEGSANVDEDNVGENAKADEDSGNSEQSIVSSTPPFQSPQPELNDTLTQERQMVAQLYLDTLVAIPPPAKPG